MYSTNQPVADTTRHALGELRTDGIRAYLKSGLGANIAREAFSIRNEYTITVEKQTK